MSLSHVLSLEPQIEYALLFLKLGIRTKNPLNTIKRKDIFCTCTFSSIKFQIKRILVSVIHYCLIRLSQQQIIKETHMVLFITKTKDINFNVLIEIDGREREREIFLCVFYPKKKFKLVVCKQCLYKFISAPFLHEKS